MEKMSCYIISTWHSESYVLDKQHLIVSEYCPVAYGGGQGLYSVKGYYGCKNDDYCSIIIDSSFTIQEGKHPMEDDGLMCDGIKDAISSVVSKALAIIQMEVGKKLNIIIDNLDMSESTPPQLVEINNWIIKKLIIDYDGTINELEYEPTKYFAPSEDMSQMTTFIVTWDRFDAISVAILEQMQDMSHKIRVTSETQPYISDMIHDCDRIIESINEFKAHLENISK